ncbi:alpha/beta fold hydrolase [Aquisalimonas sp.]|uniref:alpha/beta fold hydrolase n=1 Tax=Aquisalimonas sp. TaxID=1872621 RepID=UPI0025BE4D5E|nr:alpha/beta fold hydrolase [Aquisalimonas sp.]
MKDLCQQLRWRLLITAGAAALLGACQTSPVPSERFDVSDMETPRVEPGDPAESFWRDQVIYPFSVNYETVTDARGMAYEIAYMDEYRGDAAREDAPVLVLVHGKGADAGSFSLMMRDALERGLRVIAFDIPHYGKSIPGNLDADTYTRTLQDTREAIHELLADRLGIQGATFMGHSMGAQWALGYALDWPEQVDRLILAAPAGLEEYPRVLTLPGGELPWMDPEYKRDFEHWQAVWEPLGRLEQEWAKTEQDIRDFYSFRERDPDTGETREASVGFFLRDTQDSEFLTETRVGMIDGNQEEYEAWIIAFVRDIYTMGIESLSDDADSLVKRLDELTIPVFLALGERDPLLPTTAATGNEDMRWDVVRPAWEALSEQGAAPVVKFYDDAAHFIHVDEAEAFNADVVRFAYGATIDGTEDPGDYEQPAVELPDDVQAFVRSDEEAVLSGDMDAIMEHYHPDYRDEGRDRSDQRAMLSQVVPALSRYEIELTAFERDGDKAIVEGAIRTDFGSQSLPSGAMLIQDDGQWFWYGNQQ